MSARWPRMMKRKTAAEYVDMTESAFENEVAQRRLPDPIQIGGRDHWCRLALDKALDHLSGAGDVPSYREDLRKRYGSQAA